MFLEDQLLWVDERDVLLAFTFRRYSVAAAKALRVFRERGAKVVLITDSASAPAARWADQVLVAQCSSASPFDLLHRADGAVQCLAGGGGAALQAAAGRARAARPCGTRNGYALNASAPVGRRARLYLFSRKLLPDVAGAARACCMAASTSAGRFCCVYHNRGCLGPGSYSGADDNNKERSMFDSSHVPRRAGLRRDHQRRRPAVRRLHDHHADFIGHARRAAQVAQQRGRRDLGKLYQASPQSRELVRAKGVLIFPDVLSGSFIIGAEHGKGVLRVGGATGYYSTTAGSIGFQAGAQSKAGVVAVHDARRVGQVP